MKNTFKLIGIIALVAVIGFSSVACRKAATTAEGSGGVASGKLTITGLPSGGDYNVFICKSGTDISNITAILNVTQSLNSYLATSKLGSSGNVFDLVSWIDGQTSDRPFTASGSLPVLLFDGRNSEFSYATVNFTNGNGTVQLSSFTAASPF